MAGKEPEDSEGRAELRQKAEELAGRKQSLVRDVSMDDAQAMLLHDLEVHQIELELQNEELRRAQQELQASRDRYADLFEFAPVGYFMLDGHFKIVEVNLTGSRILDTERRDLSSMRLSEFVMPAQQDAFHRWMIGDGHEGGNSCELMMHRRDGTPFFAELKAAKDPGTDGAARYQVAVADRTDRKRMEDELKRSRDELELRVRERTKNLHERSEQLRRMTGQLALAEQRERQRLSHILHDGLQQILVAAKFRLDIINRNTDLLQAKDEVSELIDTAIDTSRSLTAELSPPILLHGDFVSSLEWLARWMHDKHGLEVNLVSHRKMKPFTTEATLLLFQAVRELLFNVVKHSGVDTVRIDVSQFEDRIVLSIEDEGVGFDMRKLHSKKRPSGGAGLRSVQERISYIGGHLEIDSTPGRGSRFELIAPLSILAGETESAIREESQARISVVISPELDSPLDGKGKSIRIMLVDDHMVMRQGLAALLRGEPDFEIAGEASDGEAAVKLARDIRPDIVLMDISMPRMDGIQATRIIHREMRETRIIGLSMFQEAEQEAAIREAGAVGYVSKTGPSGDLISAIRTSVSEV